MAFNISYVYEVIDKSSKIIDKIKKKQIALARAMNIAAKKAAKSMEHITKAQQRNFDNLKDQAVKAAAVIATAYVLAMPIRKAIAFEAAMADVAKVVDFPEPGGLKKMARSIKIMATELPVTQEGLAAIVAQGGQLGVPVAQLAEFASLAAKMSIAFDIAPDAAAEAMAKLSNILNIPVQEMGRIGDAINFVSNNAAASAEDIVIALKSGAGAGARAMGLTAEQAIALSAQFVAQGLSASEAGTRVQILARNLLNTVKTTKLLGQGFTNLVKNSPQVAIEKLLDAVAAGKIPQSALNELLGLTVNDFTLLAKSGDSYQRILGLVSDKTKFAGSMQAEFASRSATTDNQMILLGNSMNNIAINIGSIFLPAVNAVAKVIASMANTVAMFVEDFPSLTKGLGAVALAMLSVKTAVIAWKTAQILLNLALLANPVGLIITAIAAAIALVITFSDEINRFVSSLIGFENIGKSIAGVFGFGDSKSSDIKAPGAQELSGRLGIDINLAGNTGAVESASARPIGGGNLGMNMAFAQ